MCKIISLSIFTFYIISNLNSVLSVNLLESFRNESERSRFKSDLKILQEEEEENPSESQRDNETIPAPQEDPVVVSKPHNSQQETVNRDFLLTLIYQKLFEVDNQLNKGNTNIIEKYNLGSLIVGKYALNLNKRPTIQACSKLGWDDPTSQWKKRLSTYNYHVCRLDQGGSGDCFFHSMAGSLRLSGFTAGKLRELNVDNPNFTRFFPQELKNDEFLTHVHLRKMASAYFVTYNPELKDDYKKFDKDTFLDRMSFYSVQEESDLVNSEDKIKFKLAKSLNDTPVLDVAKKVYDLHCEVSGDHWGDAFDKFAFESILNITILLFRSEDSCLLLGDYDSKKTPKAYVLIYYMDMRHYQSAGIVNIEEMDKVRSAFLAEELPDVLSLIAFVDTGIELKR